MMRYWLSLGSNLGSPIEQLTSAINDLSQHVQVIEVSSLYETDPIGPVEQNCFIHLCMAIDTDMDAQSLLDTTQSIEAAHHRKREIHWGPRTLDIDLLMGPDAVQSEHLTLPHPEMLNRDFVLIPLGELACAPALNIGYPDPASDTVRKLQHTDYPSGHWTAS